MGYRKPCLQRKRKSGSKRRYWLPMILEPGVGREAPACGLQASRASDFGSRLPLSCHIQCLIRIPRSPPLSSCKISSPADLMTLSWLHPTSVNSPGIFWITWWEFVNTEATEDFVTAAANKSGRLKNGKEGGQYGSFGTGPLERPVCGEHSESAQKRPLRALLCPCCLEKTL